MTDPVERYLIVTKDGQPYPSARYPEVVEVDPDRPGQFTLWHGIIGTGGRFVEPYAARPAKNKAEREAVARVYAARMADKERYSLKRWAKRDGTTVDWGNVIAGMNGQSFREEFATETEAVERERQALAGESIGVDRDPVAIVRGPASI